MTDRPTDPADAPPEGFQVLDREHPLIGARVTWEWTGPKFERLDQEPGWVCPGVVVAGPTISSSGDGFAWAHIVVLQDDGLIRVWKIDEPGGHEPWTVKVIS